MAQIDYYRIEKGNELKKRLEKVSYIDFAKFMGVEPQTVNCLKRQFDKGKYPQRGTIDRYNEAYKAYVEFKKNEKNI